MLEQKWRKAQGFPKYCRGRTKVFQIGPIQGTAFCIDYACQNNSIPYLCYTFTKCHKNLIAGDPTQKRNLYLHCINLFSCGMLFFAMHIAILFVFLILFKPSFLMGEFSVYWVTVDLKLIILLVLSYSKQDIESTECDSQWHLQLNQTVTLK